MNMPHPEALTQVTLITTPSGFAGNGQSMLPHNYNRVLRIAHPHMEPVSTSLDWPSVERFGSQRHNMTYRMAGRLVTYLTDAQPAHTRPRNNDGTLGSDGTLDFAFWMTDGVRAPYDKNATAAKSIIENGMRTNGYIALGDLGILGFGAEAGGPEVQAALVGLGPENGRRLFGLGPKDKCLFGQDGWVGIASYETVRKNQTALAGIRVPKERASKLALFARASTQR